jgi:hypothetical protein
VLTVLTVLTVPCPWRSRVVDPRSARVLSTTAHRGWVESRARLSSWSYWSAVHVFTFSLVPLDYRVAFVAVKNFFWGGYLSWASADHRPDDGPAAGGLRRSDSRAWLH